MIPDDRLRELLQRTQDAARADPAFLDSLFSDLIDERRRPARRIWGAGPRLAMRLALAPLAIGGVLLAVAVLPSFHNGQVGGPTASPTKTGSPFASGQPGGASPSPSPSASPNPASASPSTSPPSPSGSAGSADIPLGPLAPGPYSNSAGVPFSFTAEAGWQVYGDAGTYLQLSDAGDATSSLWFAQAFGFADPAAAVDLWTNQGLVSSSKSVTIGGIKGTQVMAVASEDSVMFGLASDGSDSFGLVSGTAARVFIADIGGVVVTVVAEASDSDTLAAFLPKADKLLKTLQFKP